MSLLPTVSRCDTVSWNINDKDVIFQCYNRDRSVTRLQDVPAAPVMRTLIGALTMVANGKSMTIIN